ncbi:CocE/NonD family hydrolase [Sphingomonas sp. QA11]|uniref:CocE/NonD family hydrolase n=1 Tax=Sphingomonas sp. QA11 TaxID=2950605 RepID=UPI002349D50D|nr:CocE/NonD family hydrolase [Sphingomonas sp. QA11]WCM28512.1 CocE/NonD family hydrolase [Sphingomonas sp. QA11]
MTMLNSRRDFLAATVAGLALGRSAVARAGGRAPWNLPEKGEVKRIDVVRIEMRDGIRLCGRLWLPAHAETKPAPVVLEYIPYRTRDAYSAADDYWGETLASHGIGFARIDIRGSGDSEGLLHDEYLASEQDDAAQIIAWLASQPWCNGSVGMRGISWGGFSTLQTAMLNPPALKAIMPMACSDRRYTDDAHYIGGCLGLTNFKWGTNFKAVMAGPPDPAIAGPAWKRMWQERLEASPPIIARWTEHQHEDAYWRHGSLRFDYAAVKCPTYVVGGWADAYVHSVPRLLEGLTCLRKALVGPWGHTYPWLRGPGPALDWAFEEIRWWSQWLRGEDTGIMEEPMLRFYRPTATAAQSAPGEMPGEWAAEAVWPSRHIRPRRLYLTDKGLSPSPGPASTRRHQSHNAVGLKTPEWVPFGQEEMPGDQRADDALSITYDLAPLEADMDLLGVPTVRLRVAADKPVAQVAARLCKVMPDGTSWRLAYGLLNLTHRDGHDAPRRLIPGKPVEVEISLGFIAQRLKAGERLRLAISEGLWPLAWPSPDSPTLTLEPGGSTLTLPIRVSPPIEAAMPVRIVPIAPDKGDVVVKTTDEDGRLSVSGVWPDKPRTCANGTQLSGYGPNTVARITRGDPNSGIWSGERVSRYRRDDWNCEIRIAFEVRSTSAAFDIVETIKAFDNGAPVFSREAKRSIKRSLV